MSRIRKIRTRKKRIFFTVLFILCGIFFYATAQEVTSVNDTILLEINSVYDTDYRAQISSSDKNVALKKYADTRFELIGYPEDDSIRWAQMRHIKDDRQVVLSLPLVSRIKQKPDVRQTIEAEGNARLLEIYFKSLTETVTEEEAQIIAKNEDEYGVGPVKSGIFHSGNNDNPYDASAIELNEKIPDEISWNTQVCPNRIDMSNMQVYPQTAMIKTVNGVETEKQTCQDSGLPMSIVWTYTGCTPKIDLTDNTVTAMRRPYYIQNGEQIYIGECEAEEDRVYEIKESFNCPVLFDLSKMEATEQSLFYYDDPQQGTSVTISECQAREDARTFEIKRTYDTCSYRPEPSEGIVYQQEKLIYDKDGITVSISPCTDSEKTYPIETEYCYTKENWSAGTVTNYERSKVHTVQGVFYLTDCQPVKQTDIKETVVGCETLHTDYFEAKYSKGWSRFYYEQDKTKKYLTECQETNTVYQHQFDIEDWQADFETHQAVALMSPYIELPSVGRIQLKSPEKYDNSLRVPLAKVREELVGDGVFTYTGCDRYEGQLNKITYLLPNNLEVDEFVPVSEKKYSANVCKTELEKYQIWVGTGWTCGSTHGCKRPQFAQVYVNFQRLKYKNLITGEVMCEPWEKVSQVSAGGNIGSYPGYASLGAHTECGGYAYPNSNPGFCVNGVLTGNSDCYFAETQ